MITYLDTAIIDSATTRIEAVGLSTDTKPTMYSNRAVSLNSLFLELDTKTLYYCSKSGSSSEEVVYEGEPLINEKDGDVYVFRFEPFVPADTLRVVLDGKEYVVNKSKYNDYGATMGTSGFDWSEYPFYIWVTPDYGNINVPTSGTHSLSISSINKTEAEWTVYGEKGGSGDMINVYFVIDAFPNTDLTTQMARDGSITLPNVPDALGGGKWKLTSSNSMSLNTITYTGGSPFTLPENADEYIYTTSDLDMTAPYIKFEKYSGGLS